MNHVPLAIQCLYDAVMRVVKMWMEMMSCCFQEENIRGMVALLVDE